MSKSLQQIILLLLIIVLGNVLYWSLNERFLHEDLLGMVLGQSDTPLVTSPETLPPPAPTATPELQNTPQPVAMTNYLSANTSSDFTNETVELINTIAGLQAEIGALEMQADDISEVVDTLASQAQLTNLKLDEIQASFGLTDEQFQALLIELQTSTPTSAASSDAAVAE